MPAKVSLRALDAALTDATEPPAAWLDRMAPAWPADEALLRHLVAFAEGADPSSQMAATGLLKRHLAAGASLPGDVTARLLALLPALVRWEARLHLLQMLPALEISRADAAALRAALNECLAAKERNRFVRAWACNGLHCLATRFPEFRAEIQTQLGRASREESAAVRARLRRLPSWA